jgi:hypothetical protein
MFQGVNQWDLSKICYQSKKMQLYIWIVVGQEKVGTNNYYLLVYTDFILHQKKKKENSCILLFMFQTF